MCVNCCCCFMHVSIGWIDGWFFYSFCRDTPFWLNANDCSIDFYILFLHVVVVVSKWIVGARKRCSLARARNSRNRVYSHSLDRFEFRWIKKRTKKSFIVEIKVKQSWSSYTPKKNIFVFFSEMALSCRSWLLLRSNDWKRLYRTIVLPKNFNFVCRCCCAIVIFFF